MSSTNKTEYLKLNNWASTDIPKRSDFNYDNAVIDEAVNNHCNDENLHINSAERDRWNRPYHMGFYYGNGESVRTIETGCPFEPSFGMIFANGTAPSVTNFSGSFKSNYFALMSLRANTIGASLSGSNIVVKSPSNAVISNEFASLNTSGYTYCYVLFR